MGEPLIASLVCGAVALSMVIWNWRLMESQRAHGRTCARECASRAQQSAKVRHDAGASHNACSRPMTLEAPAQYIVNREGEGEAWNQRPSPMFVKSSRDRAETSPMSPPATASPMGIDGKERGFFTDSSRFITLEDRACRDRAPSGADLDSFLNVPTWTA